MTNTHISDAIIDGDLKRMISLIDSGLDFHENNEGALRLAILKSNVEIVEYLINKGANINVMNGAPLRLAAHCHNSKIINLILEKSNFFTALNYLTSVGLIETANSIDIFDD